MLTTPRIVCAANKHPTNGRIICGARHYDSVMRAQMEASEGFDSWRGCEQGFIDQHCHFYSREEAKVIAEKNGQVIAKAGSYTGKDLFSENLY